MGILAHHPVDRPSDVGHVIDQTLGKLNNRCLIAIISDFFEEPARLRSALARVKHRAHDVIMCQVVDQQELTFPFTESAPFEGLEGEGRIRLDPRAVRAEYLRQITAHLERIEKVARGFGFDYMRLTTHDWLGPAIASFVARRGAVLKRSKGG